jgi:hypothetical protein
MISYHRQETLQPDRAMGDLLAEHGTLYSAGMTWHPEPGHTTSFTSRYYFSHEECDQATARLLREAGYKPPRFWQWWRWDEPRPNKAVRTLLSQLTASP